LHDDRRSGPQYQDLPGRAPLVDDHPSHVRALAVEIAAGEPQTEYLIGAELAIAGELIASVPVEAPAPNDIVGTPDEKAKIATGRAAFAAAVQRAFANPRSLLHRRPAALVVRHRPQRDEDNTWATWIAAVCGPGRQGPTHWAYGAPLAGWVPTAVVSTADPTLETPVLYEVWSGPAGRKGRDAQPIEAGSGPRLARLCSHVSREAVLRVRGAPGPLHRRRERRSCMFEH